MKKVVFNSLVITFAILATFTSCSNPESDGKKAAKEVCDCYQRNLEFQQKEYSNFLNNKFQTRIELRDKKQEMDEKISKQFNECYKKTQEKYRKISEKYAANKQKTEQFEYAFKKSGEVFTKKVREDNSEKINLLASKIENLRLSIIPPKPDAEKIKRNLIGKVCIDDYREFSSRNIKIETEKIKELQIVRETKQDDDYLFEIRLIMQEDSNDYEALINMTYVLRQNDDWEIDKYENKEFNIIKTGKYEKCVTATLLQGRYVVYQERYLEITNHCDVDLVVGGMVLTYSTIKGSSTWEKFRKIVVKNSKNEIRTNVYTDIGQHVGSIREYQIHFVELQ